ncbi:pitrilysin [Thorsellia anophelis]|uniref:Protease 3 n=1 Tax=Thorsellia anophelis DSM 18579 TaxID=1123402 RepID=A0A1H9ZRT5_9GAMM|nr:pitrilysin [Thorsellia anophelis]SES84414.1 protease-3 [Thorsellia anophelis DSM 18579]
MSKNKKLKKSILTTSLIAALMSLSVEHTRLNLSKVNANDVIQSQDIASKEISQNHTWTVLPNKINKSPADNRDYQAIKLANGMTVLLVSDPKATRSLGVLALPIGSLDDPKDQQGLAHYLEHMVLMGSTKYPEPSGFSEFLNKHGGSHNASTASYRTNYYFEIDDSGLDEALDRLADAIASPLLDPSNADKERNAVNAELTLARSRDGMRMAQVSSETINPNHPASQFFGGNLETLRDKPGSQLQSTLVEFYQKFYSSNYMVGVIYSPRPVTELAKLANETFGRIQDKSATVPIIKEPIVRKEDKGVIINYVPVQPLKQLQIEFRLPDTHIDTKSLAFLEKNETYISYLIGNSSQGSLAQTLKSQGLIESIYAGASLEQNRNAGIFSINIDLTDKGLKSRDKIIAAVFNYLNLIKTQGIEQSYFDEVKRVLNIDYEFPTLTRDMDYVSGLAENMLIRPIEHVVDADNAISTFNKDAILSRLSDMTIDNARIWFISPEEPHTKTAYFMQAPYQVNAISDEQKAKWRTLEKEWHFSLPQLNPYLADDFSIHYDASQIIAKPARIENSELANLSQDTSLATAAIKVFSMPSKAFIEKPNADITLTLRSPLPKAQLSPEQKMNNQILFALSDYLAGLALDELSYQASVAGIDFSSYYNNGLVISANGYTQHLLELMMSLTKQYATFIPTEQQFNQAKVWYLDQLLTADKVKPFELALQPLQTVSRVPYFEREARRIALEKLSIKDLIDYRDSLFKEKQFELLSVGNLTKTQIANFIHQFNQSLPDGIAKQGESFEADFGRRIVFDKPRQIQLTREGTTTDSALAAVYLPIQTLTSNAQNRSDIESSNSHNEATTKLLNEIIQPWFYDKLRSQEQLGYALFTLPFSLGEQWGIGFLIQSNIKQPAQLLTYFNAFYDEASSKLEKLDDSTFKQYQSGLLAQLNEPSQTLNEEANQFKADFFRGRYDFNAKETLITSVENLTRNDVVAFFNQTVLGQNRFAILSELSGTEQDTPEFTQDSNWSKVENVSTLQSTLTIEQQ